MSNSHQPKFLDIRTHRENAIRRFEDLITRYQKSSSGNGNSSRPTLDDLVAAAEVVKAAQLLNDLKTQSGGTKNIKPAASSSKKHKISSRTGALTGSDVIGSNHSPHFRTARAAAAAEAQEQLEAARSLLKLSRSSSKGNHSGNNH